MENSIITERLELVPFEVQDYGLFHRLNIDPYIKKYMWDNEDIDLDMAKEIMEKNRGHFTQDHFGIWKVKLKETGQVIGYTGLWHFFDEPQPQLIYALLKKFSKKGYATEFSKAIIEYSFEKLGFKYLIAATDKPNLESQMVAKRLGMNLQEMRIENDKPTLFYRIENKGS